MPEVKLKIYNKNFQALASSVPGVETSLVYTAPYADGDVILLEMNEDCKFCVIQLEDTMPPALVYTPGKRIAFLIPTSEKRSNYSPKSFSGNCHLIRARAARPDEISARRNLAFNPYDAGRETGFFPHAVSSVEAQDVGFVARNAVDGIFENNCHGNWPYQAWGINKNPDATLKIEFGRSVTIDEICLTLRADFPHDSWWTSVTVQFSDGSHEVLTLERTGKPQSFPVASRTIEWLELRELQKAEDTSEFPALTQLEVFGTETK